MVDTAPTLLQISMAEKPFKDPDAFPGSEIFMSSM
jgi:hypothetical protein